MSTTTPADFIFDQLAEAGTLTVGQLSSITKLKRIDVESNLKSLAVDGKVEKVGGSVWRVRPGLVERLNAKVVRTPKATVPTPKAAVGRKSRPRRDAVLDAVKDAGGLAHLTALIDATGFKDRTVSDAAFRLKGEGILFSPSPGWYALPGTEIPKDFDPPKRVARSKKKRTNRPADNGRGPVDISTGVKPKGVVGLKVYEALAAAGGEAAADDLAEALNLPVKRVTDSLFHLTARGWTERVSRGVYRLVAPAAPETAAEAPVAAAEETVAPIVVKGPAEQAPVLVDVAALNEAAPSTEDLVADLMAIVAPDGLPATSKAATAAAKFIKAAERLIVVARG